MLDPEFRTDFRRYWEDKGKPANGSMLSIDYQYLTDLFAEIRGQFDFLRGKKFTPHFARKTHVNVLREAGVPLETITGDARAGDGYVGVG
ncbi:MAG TPA: hypothetical protein VND40_05855 [Nitrososphaerales archaeon]|nr:hypothetical protein [Nitrososphaerales archaeon]